jgi:hypothetical protein
MKPPRFLLAALLPLAASAALAATVTVLVQEATLRKRPQFFAPPAGTARLGQKFEATGPDAGWYKTSGGYLHQSSVTAKKVKLGSASEVGGSASAEEVTLAGKGFNAQVEKSYGEKNGEANFRGVDAMERRSVSETALFEFLKQGALIPAGGAQ